MTVMRHKTTAIHKRFLMMLIMMPLLTAVTALTQGCTHNNGDIGRWFGTWSVENILVNGEPYAAYDHNMVWKFQNSVFSMQLINTNPIIHDRQQRWGSWSESGNTLILDFTHSDNTDAPGEGIYVPFLVSLLNRTGVTVLDIEKSDGKSLTLGFTNNQGERITYLIKKQ